MRNSIQTRACALLILLAIMAATLALGAPDPNNPTGTAGLIMIDKRGGYVRFFDPATLKEVSNLTLEAPPHELAISPDHKTAYIPLYGDGVYGNNPNPGHKIVAIDLPTRKVTNIIDVSPYVAPHGLQVDNSGTLYASCDTSRKLLVIDPQDGEDSGCNRYGRYRALVGRASGWKQGLRCKQERSDVRERH
jgi:hypothetical protein